MSSITSPADSFALDRAVAPAAAPPRASRAAQRLRVVVAGNWWLRTRGLLARPAPAPGEGMLFPGCASVHTCFMAYPIDLVYLDRASVIAKVRAHVRPWRFSAGGGGSRHVLELAAGEADRLGLRVGERLAFDSDREVAWAR